MAQRLLLNLVLLLAFANPALASWWIVRAADGKCLVVDVEPSGNDVAKIGKEVYRHNSRPKPRSKPSVKKISLGAPPQTPSEVHPGQFGPLACCVHEATQATQYVG